VIAKKRATRAKRAKRSVGMKTKKTAASVAAHLARVPDAVRRSDCDKLAKLMRRATGAKAAMWGSIVGFGQYHYVYASGREGDWPLTGFAPRKKDLTVYIMTGFERYASQLRRLGPHDLGKSCLYLSSLDGIDLGVLEDMVRDSVRRMRASHAGP
jgi:hypothetical protein